MTEIQVEFFGMARQLAGCETTTVTAQTVAEVIAKLSERYPELASRCFDQGTLNPSWIFNVDGSFVRDGSQPVPSGSSILLMSADAGG